MSKQYNEAKLRWIQNNPEKYEESKRKYIENNQEKIRESQRKYAEKNPEKIRESGRRWREYNPTYARERHLKIKHGLSLSEWNGLFESQACCCAVCKTTEPGGRVGWSVDHDHRSGKIRGILCNRCNIALGMVDDDVSLLAELIKYIGTRSDEEEE